VRCFHFNYLLFVPIWLARQVFRVFDIKGSSESQINTTLLNILLSRVFDLDVRTARGWHRLSGWRRQQPGVILVKYSGMALAVYLESP